MVDLAHIAGGREPMTPPQSLLLVDFRDGPRFAAKWFLSDFGHRVFCARTAEEALRIFDPEVHQVVVLDAILPDMAWLEVARELRDRSPETPILVVRETTSGEEAPAPGIRGQTTRLVALKEALELLEREM